MTLRILCLTPSGDRAGHLRMRRAKVIGPAKLGPYPRPAPPGRIRSTSGIPEPIRISTPSPRPSIRRRHPFSLGISPRKAWVDPIRTATPPGETAITDAPVKLSPTDSYITGQSRAPTHLGIGPGHLRSSGVDCHRPPHNVLGRFHATRVPAAIGRTRPKHCSWSEIHCLSLIADHVIHW